MSCHVEEIRRTIKRALILQYYYYCCCCCTTVVLLLQVYRKAMHVREGTHSKLARRRRARFVWVWHPVQSMAGTAVKRSRTKRTKLKTRWRLASILQIQAQPLTELEHKAEWILFLLRDLWSYRSCSNWKEQAPTVQHMCARRIKSPPLLRAEANGLFWEKTRYYDSTQGAVHCPQCQGFTPIIKRQLRAPSRERKRWPAALDQRQTIILTTVRLPGMILLYCCTWLTDIVNGRREAPQLLLIELTGTIYNALHQ